MRRGRGRGGAERLERWDRVGKLRVFSREWPGPAPEVVLVHGLSVSGRYMVPTAEWLASRHRVLAPDLPGFGRSGRPERVLDVPELAEVLAGWLERVASGPAVLLGNSMGCQVAAEVAVRRPDLVTGLVLAGPTVDPARRNPVQQIGRWLLDIPREPFPLIPVVLRDYLAAGPRRTLLSYVALMGHRVEEVLPRVGVPALVVRGGRDPIAPRDWAERAAGLLRRGALAEIPGAGHAVNFNSRRRWPGRWRSSWGGWVRSGRRRRVKCEE